MKHFFRKTMAFAAAFAIFTTSVSANTLGSWLWRSNTMLGDSVKLSSGQFASSTYQTENVVEFSASDGLIPMVAYGDTIYGRSTMSYIAADLKDDGYTPVAAVNGSFFNLANGIPYGAVVTDGVLRVSGSSQAVGFFPDGSAIIGNPDMTLSITLPDGTVTSAHYNREMTKSSGLNLFSRDYDTTTKDLQKAYYVVLKPEIEELSVGETRSYEVVDRVADAVNFAIPEGHVVLAMDNESQYQYTFNYQLKALEIGDVITVKSNVAEGWEDVAFVCGGDDLLVSGGVAASSFSLDSAKKRTGRTAVGIKADGSVVLYTVDGLQSSYSSGLTLAELSTRMAELGCVTALNLDGGGSTTSMGRFLGNDGLTQLNRPSDGAQRKCANFIFLVRETTAPAAAEKLHLYPYDGMVLAGASLAMTVKATDGNDMATTVPESLEYSASSGFISNGGTFTAGKVGETVTITAQSGGVSGSETVTVVENPSTITIKNQSNGLTATSLTIQGEAAMELTATAVLYGATLTAQDHNFTWSVDEKLGKISESGRFVAASTAVNLTGNITVSAGTCSATLPVTVTAQDPEGALLEPMETVMLGDGNGVAGTVNTNRAFVRYGSASGRLDYDLDLGYQGYVNSKIQVNLPESYSHLGLWVYGDNSNNSLSAIFETPDGLESKWLTQLNFSGWKWVSVQLPEGATALSSLKIVSYEDATASKGTIYIDQICGSSPALQDETAPNITMKVGETAVSISATDSGSGVAKLQLWVDGTTADFTNSWSLPTDGTAHQLRVLATDAYGNMAMKSLEIPGEQSAPFVDMNNHWSSFYVNYAYDHGYLNGSTNSQGQLEFRPDSPMTRQEFAVALMNFLAVDCDQYAGQAMVFDDGDQVASWAENQVKAAYYLGLLSGSTQGDLLLANPTATITRQEAMVILARTLEKGYEMGDLSQFSDHSAIDHWALQDIAIMVGQGVISGADGLLSPTATVTRGQVAKMLAMLY